MSDQEDSPEKVEIRSYKTITTLREDALELLSNLSPEQHRQIHIAFEREIDCLFYGPGECVTCGRHPVRCQCPPAIEVEVISDNNKSLIRR